MSHELQLGKYEFYAHEFDKYKTRIWCCLRALFRELESKLKCALETD